MRDFVQRRPKKIGFYEVVAQLLLNFGTTASVRTSPTRLKILQVVRHRRPGDLADSRGYLANAYGASQRTLMLIRPNGYVALISDAGDVSAVSHYLAAVGWRFSVLLSLYGDWNPAP